MNGDYIKIMSDGTQLFVKGTECFLSLNGQYVRPTVDQFVELVKRGVDDFLGEHVVGCHFESEGPTRNIPNGTKIWDLEWCELYEFYFVYSSESKQIFNGNQIIPSFNKTSCEFFNAINQRLNLNGMFATNGGEYHIKELGYFIDYYEPIKNLVVDWDEPQHYNVDGTLKSDDVRRQKEIIEYLKCKFYRINQKAFNEELVTKEIDEYITNKQ